MVLLRRWRRREGAFGGVLDGMARGRRGSVGAGGPASVTACRRCRSLTTESGEEARVGGGKEDDRGYRGGRALVRRDGKTPGACRAVERRRARRSCGVGSPLEDPRPGDRRRKGSGPVDLLWRKLDEAHAELPATGGWATGIARRRRRSPGGVYEERYRKGQRGSARKLGGVALGRSRRLLTGANHLRRDSTLVARGSGTESMGAEKLWRSGLWLSFVLWFCFLDVSICPGCKDWTQG
ncbi:Uncharacterized protein M6B38_237725 [Iris pallida]|uniref:Uncharacterized protein n=1 Tax=Iris pallida TaxID=29817 RepID=A0AAX6DM95_IRIPA|nr:Uncharacterized protein M6B38_237725 [Iris pallida]